MAQAGSDDLPLVSILVATYNQEAFVAETLESCLAQTYPNFEVVVADDASTDGTRAILADYARRDPRIRLVLAETNGGITVNCNRLLDAAQGELLAFLGGDDLCMPDRIETQAGLFVRNARLSACMSAVEVFFDDGSPSYVYSEKGFARAQSGEEIINVNNHPPTSGMMYRRTLAPDRRFDERLRVVSDWLFVVQAHLSGDIAYIDRPLVRYRRHSGNTTGVTLSRYYLDDRLASAEILQAEHPKLADRLKLYRSRTLANASKAALVEGLPGRVPRGLAASAVAQAPLNGLAWACLGMAMLPRGLRTALMTGAVDGLAYLRRRQRAKALNWS